MEEYLQVFLASSALAGAVGGTMTIALEWFRRRWKKQDEKEAKSKVDVNDMSNKIDALVDANKVIMVDRVRYLGQNYIVAKKISLESKENLNEMYKAYKALGGNGHLETVMYEINRLEVVGDKERG